MARGKKARPTSPASRATNVPGGWQPSSRTAIACAIVFSILFAGSEVFSLRLSSATWDEPGHLLAVYAALTRGDYRADIEHPPLLRAWAALPLLTLRVHDGA